jgi:serine/threonine protein kinase/WD40 repeat protein
MNRRTGRRVWPGDISPMPVVLDRFLESLRQSGLMSEEEIADFLAGLGEDEKPATGDDLAQLLHRYRKLTRFQIQSVYQGKTKGLVLGNYVVLDKIGQGGMGHVYQAQHRRMKRVVALKVLPSAVAKSEKAVERFQREVEAAARLSHPHVVTAYDADQADGVHFLVMEYVAGADLSALVRREGPLPVATALDYVLQAARGLAYAHAQGVIHRDIKPSNLMLDPEGTVKILDLGLARFQRDLESAPDAPALTQTGQLMGTVDFIAPEQAMDTRSADARSDIYSLGCTLFYLLTGRAVYPTGSFAQKVVAHMTHTIPSLSDLRDEVPEELDAVFQRLVAKRPEERPQSMEEVIAELESCRALVGDSRQASQDTSAIFRGPTGGGDTEPSVGTAAPRPGTRRSVTDGPDGWLHQPLPSAATVFRATRVGTWVGARRSQVLAALAIAAGLVGLLLLGSIVASLRTDQGTLVVEVDEPGASVQVLDTEGQIVVRGVSEADPLTFSLDPGTHRLRVEKDGFTFFAQEFTLDRRGQQVIRARLEPVPEQPGTVLLTVNQPDAAVDVLDMAGKTVARYRTREEPLAIPLAAGSYSLLVEKEGCEPQQEPLVVAASQELHKTITLATIRSIAEEAPSSPTDLRDTVIERPKTPDVAIKDAAAQSLGNPASLLIGARQIPGLRSWTVETIGHRGFCYDGALSPDGNCYASAGEDGVIRFFDAQNGSLIKMLIHPECEITAIAWSRDSVRLAVGTRAGTVSVWDVDAGQPDRFSHGVLKAVRDIDWCPTGAVLAVCTDGDQPVWLLDVSENLSVRESKPGPWTDYPAVSADWSPDGRYLAVAGRATMCVYDFEQSRLVEEWGFSADDSLPVKISSVAWSPVGAKIAVCQNKYVHLWCTNDWKRKDTFELPWAQTDFGGSVGSSTWSHDGNRLAISHWGGGSIIDVEQRIRVGLPSCGYGDDLIGLSWSPDDSTIYGTGLGTGEVLASNVTSLEDSVWRVEGVPIPRAIAMSSDGRFLAIAGDQGFRRGAVVWDTSTDTIHCDLKHSLMHTSDLCWSARGELAIADRDSVKIWSTVEDSELQQLNTIGHVHAVQWSPDGSLLAFAHNRGHENEQPGVSIWQPDQDTPPRDVFRSDDVPLRVAWTPDDTFLAVGFESGSVIFLDVDSGEHLGTVRDPAGDPITGLAYTRDRRLAVATLNLGRVFLHQLDSGEQLNRSENLGPHVFRIMSAHKGNDVIVSHSNGVFLYETESFSQIGHVFPGLECRWVSGSEDGSLLAILRARQVGLWQRTQNTLQRWYLTWPDEGYLAIQPDGTWSGPIGIEERIRYVVMVDNGCQETLTSGQFNARYGSFHVAEENAN